MNNIGIQVVYGKRVRPNNTPALGWVLRAASRGHTTVLINFANKCREGVLMERDPVEAYITYAQ